MATMATRMFESGRSQISNVTVTWLPLSLMTSRTLIRYFMFCIKMIRFLRLDTSSSPIISSSGLKPNQKKSHGSRSSPPKITMVGFWLVVSWTDALYARRNRWSCWCQSRWLSATVFDKYITVRLMRSTLPSDSGSWFYGFPIFCTHLGTLMTRNCVLGQNATRVPHQNDKLIL